MEIGDTIEWISIYILYYTIYVCLTFPAQQLLVVHNNLVE